jgi:hypothetical protein
MTTMGDKAAPRTETGGSHVSHGSFYQPEDLNCKEWKWNDGRFPTHLSEFALPWTCIIREVMLRYATSCCCSYYIPASPTIFICALLPHVPLRKASLVLIPISLGSDPDDIPHPALAIDIHIFTDKVDASWIDEQPCRGLGSQRL